MGHQTSEHDLALGTNTGIILQLNERGVVGMNPFKIQISAEFDGSPRKIKKIICREG